MQLYILTIPLIYFYCWEKEYGWYAAIIWTLGSFILRTVLTYWVTVNNLSFQGKKRK